MEHNGSAYQDFLLVPFYRFDERTLQYRQASQS